MPDDEIKITIFATGFDRSEKVRREVFTSDLFVDRDIPASKRAGKPAYNTAIVDETEKYTSVLESMGEPTQVPIEEQMDIPAFKRRKV